MTILQESGRWISFVVCLLVVVDSTVSGFNYFEPTDVKELRLLGQVSATSCGSGSHCNSTSDCTSGIVESPQYIDILDNVEEICLADDFLSKNELHQGIKKDSNFSTTSSNLGNCTNVTKSLNGKMSTYYGLSFWIYASTPKCNLFKVTNSSSGESQVKLTSAWSIGINTLYNSKTDSKVKSGTWNHIFLRTESLTQTSVFINGEYFKPTSYTGLPQIPENVILNIDCSGIIVVDFRFYWRYLTNREIQYEINDGVSLSRLPISFPECRCPQTHPQFVMDAADPSGVFCKQLTTVDKVRRLSNGTVDNMRDNDYNTVWTSSESMPTIYFTFDQVFMIDSVKINFVSNGEPGSVEITLSMRGKKMNSKEFTSYQSNILTWDIRNSFGPLSENSTRSEVEKMVADKIEIRMNKMDPSSSVSISETSIMGRCYCNGHSNSCQISGRNFNCTCNNERKVQGDSCELCTELGKFQEEFACDNSCNCSSNGTNGNTSVCQGVGGQCNCKTNVMGRVCDVCKPLHYNLSQSNLDGCTRCICGPGTKSCDTNTGACTCKNNTETTSDRCERCLPEYYGVSGTECVPCGCDNRGIIGGNLSCLEPTGQCECKLNVQGRQCNECKDGYYNLNKSCFPCKCNKVGRMSEICDKGNKGLCTCRGNFTDQNNIRCDPVIVPNQLDPAFGPVDGNTTVTVRGKLLYRSGSNVTFSISTSRNNSPFLVNDTVIQLLTPPSTSAGTVILKLKWADAYDVDSEPPDFYWNFTFEYRPNPVVSSVQSINAFMSGGCKISVTGTNLNSVAKPKLVVYGNGINDSLEDCAPEGPGLILCNSPKGYSVGTTLRYGLQLDGIRMYEDLNRFQNNTIKIVIDPVPTREDEIVQDYKPVFETELTIEGEQFTSGCSDSDFKVMLRGSSANYSCVIKSLAQELIKCEPDLGFPGVDEEVMMMLYIGGKPYDIQKVKLHTFWNTWQFILIAVGGSVFILLVTLIPLFVCCCCRSKKMNVTNDTTDTDFTSLNNLDPQPLVNRQQNSYVDVKIDKDCWTEFIHKVNESVRKMLKSSQVDKSDIVVGSRCIKKGADVRVVDGHFAPGTGKPYAGKSTMMKTMVGNFGNFENNSVPEWVNTGLQECLRFRDMFDDNVLQMQGVSVDKERFYILYRGYKRSLKDYLNDQSNTPTKAILLNMCVQLMEGLQFIHNNGITHKDLAARNCVVDEDGNFFKVSDGAFSWSLYPEEYMYDSRREKFLPVRWMAPESLTAGFYDAASDVWAYGVLIWEIMSLALYLPYHDQEEDEKIKSYVVDSGFRLGKPELASDSLYQEIMLPCWEHQSAQRLKLSEIGDKFELLQNPGALDHQTSYVNSAELLEEDMPVYYNYGSE
ncbi:hepatocyte growth factor receptor isoform X2 [Magallana gigas]|uniref:hepatocyte growth factor receptor isoform X2 n=1 Tax=Magallana gigas TaxID=29159 RepID=UPI003342CC81